MGQVIPNPGEHQLTSTRCPQCESDDCSMNMTGTTFCFRCLLCTTRKGKVQYMANHPEFSTHGWQYHLKRDEIRRVVEALA